MELQFDSAFYFNGIVGLLGVVLWVLATWADPLDDTLSGTLGRAFGKHSRTLAVTLLSYVLLAVIFHSWGEWNLVTAVTTGYTAQSLCTKIMDNVSGKLAAKGGDK